MTVRFAYAMAASAIPAAKRARALATRDAATWGAYADHLEDRQRVFSPHELSVWQARERALFEAMPDSCEQGLCEIAGVPGPDNY